MSDSDNNNYYSKKGRDPMPVKKEDDNIQAYIDKLEIWLLATEPNPRQLIPKLVNSAFQCQEERARAERIFITHKKALLESVPDQDIFKELDHDDQHKKRLFLLKSFFSYLKEESGEISALEKARKWREHTRIERKSSETLSVFLERYTESRYRLQRLGVTVEGCNEVMSLLVASKLTSNEELVISSKVELETCKVSDLVASMKKYLKSKSLCGENKPETAALAEEIGDGEDQEGWAQQEEDHWQAVEQVQSAHALVNQIYEMATNEDETLSSESAYFAARDTLNGIVDTLNQFYEDQAYAENAYALTDWSADNSWNSWNAGNRWNTSGWREQGYRLNFGSSKGRDGALKGSYGVGGHKNDKGHGKKGKKGSGGNAKGKGKGGKKF